MQQDGSSMDRTVENRRSAGKLLVLFVLGGLAAVGFTYLYPSLSRWVSTDRSINSDRLRFGEVTRGDLLRDVSVQGKIVAADRPTLVSPAEGVISIAVRAGDEVGRGDLLARIESPEMRNRLEQELSRIQSLKSELDRLRIAARQAELQNQQQVALLEVKLRASERSMERAASLLEEGLGSSLDYEKARDEVQVARLELENARKNLELDGETRDFELKTRQIELDRQALVVEELRRRIKELAVVSPVDGLVARVEVYDKDTVQPNQKIFSVVDLSDFEVEILIPENYAVDIAIGTPALILVDGREYEGRVKSLSPEVEASQVKGVVVFDGSTPRGLKQNQRVDARLLLNARRDVLKVPRGPFLETFGGRQVYVVKDGVAVLRPIQVGAVSVTEVEVIAGLEEGDQIILSDLSRQRGAERILLRE